MHVCLDIDFQDSIVCILGGGNVAFRKAKQFLNAGAKVYISSLAYKPELESLAVYKVSAEKLDQLLRSARLAIACTNDVQANQDFIDRAKSFHVLTMSCQKGQGQDTLDMVESTYDHLKLACHTKGAFPLANKRILQDWNDRLALLKELRNRLKSSSLCSILFELNIDQLLFLKQAITTSKTIVYLFHGNTSLAALDQVHTLLYHARKRFPTYAVGYFFLSKKYQTARLFDVCTLLKKLSIQTHFVFLFWEKGRYVKEGMQAIKPFGYSCQHLMIDPHQLIEEDEVLIMHTLPHLAPVNGVLVSMLDSPFLKSQYPNHRFVAGLEVPAVLERIIHETHPSF